MVLGFLIPVVRRLKSNIFIPILTQYVRLRHAIYSSSQSFSLNPQTFLFHMQLNLLKKKTLANKVSLISLVKFEHVSELSERQIQKRFSKLIFLKSQ